MSTHDRALSLSWWGRLVNAEFRGECVAMQPRSIVGPVMFTGLYSETTQEHRGNMHTIKSMLDGVVRMHASRAPAELRAKHPMPFEAPTELRETLADSKKAPASFPVTLAGSKKASASFRTILSIRKKASASFWTILSNPEKASASFRIILSIRRKASAVVPTILSNPENAAAVASTVAGLSLQPSGYDFEPCSPIARTFWRCLRACRLTVAA